VTMIPFFFGGILAFATEIRAARESRLASSIAPGPGNRRRASPADLRNSLPLLGIFLVATIGVFPITGMDAMGVWTSNLTISESYAAALPAALLLLATAIVFWEAGGREALGIKAIGAGNIVFVFVVIPLGILLLGYLKISFMLLGFLVAVYVAAREGLLRRPVFIALATALTAAVALTYRVVSLPQHREGIVPLDFLKGFVPLEWWPFFFAVHLFWSWLYVVLRLRAEGVRTVGDLWDAAKAGRILDAEIVTIVALAGVAPGLVLHIDGGSAFYFSDVQRWLSVGFLIGGLGILVPAFHRSAGLPRVLLAFLAIPLIVTMCFNTLYWPVRMLRANVETRRALYPADVAASIPLGLRGLPHLLEGRYLQGALSAARNTRPIEGLRRLASLPLKERRQTALFIPQTESRYWQILARPGACTFAGHVAPALTGMAMVDGMPPVGCRLSPYYGLGGYAPRTRPQSEADATPDALCRRATASGLSRVMTLSFAAEGELQSRVISCRQVR